MPKATLKSLKHMSKHIKKTTIFYQTNRFIQTHQEDKYKINRPKLVFYI